MQLKILSATLAVAAVSASASADLVGVSGGQTNVDLDFDLIEAATGLAFAGVSDGVIAPGNLGPSSVAFAITSPDSAALPTTFNYDTDDFFGSFAGAIEHRGAVYFSGAADLGLGNFTIDYDVDVASFQVVDNLDLAGTALFDVKISEASPLDTTFDVKGDLVISGDFALLLLELGLATSDLSGVDVGDAWVQGLNQAVPTPGVLAALACSGLVARRRRRG